MQAEWQNVDVLREIVQTEDDHGRIVVESKQMLPYDSGLHPDDPDEQPDQTVEP